MTTNQLKIKAETWSKLFDWWMVISMVCTLGSLFLPDSFGWVYFLCVAVVILIGFRTKRWNDTYCDQRDKEYWQNRKEQVLKRLEG